MSRPRRPARSPRAATDRRSLREAFRVSVRLPCRPSSWVESFGLVRLVARRFSLAADTRAEASETLVDALVAAVDLLDVADNRAAVRRQRRGDQRHPGADVR